MSRSIRAAVFLVLLAGCSKEATRPLDEYESADVKAGAFNFQVFPNSTFNKAQTDLLRRAHFVLQPTAKEAPPIAVYETDAAIEKVAEFYAERYGYPKVAESAANNFSSVPPSAYYAPGDFANDINGLLPVLEKLGIKPDASKAVGKYRMAYIKPKENLPRVSINRPYFDVEKSQVVDKTLIVMVRE